LRLRTLVLVVVAMALVPGCARQPAPPAGAERGAGLAVAQRTVKTFRLPDSGLRMSAPQGWSFAAKPQYVGAECRPDGAKGDLPVILVQESSMATQLSLQAIVSGFSKQIAKGVQEPKVTKDQGVKLPLAGSEAYEVAYTGKLSGVPIQGSQTLIRKGRWFFVVTAMTKAGDFQKCRPVLDGFLKSLSF